MTDANLRGPDQRLRAVAELAVDREVIVQRAALDERFELRRNLRDVESGDKAQLHEGVRADVAAAAAAAGEFRIRAPGGLLLACRLELRGQPALEVIAIHPADVAEQALLDDVAREARGPVAEVGVSDAKGDVRLADGLHESLGFVEVQAKRLLAEHRNARLDRLHRRIEMDVVRRDDEDVIEALLLGQALLRVNHLGVAAVALNRVGPVGGFFERDLGIGEQCPGGDAARAVEVDCLLVRMDDECALAAADESDIERSCHRFLVLSVG